MENIVENAANKWEFEQNYGKILAMVITSAVKEIEAETGRKVISLTIPKPANYDIPEKQPTIHVRLDWKDKMTDKAKGFYDGCPGDWVLDDNKD